MRKLARAVVGTQFAQTEPWVLRSLRDLAILKVVCDVAGTFHPKLVVGRRGSEVRVIVGSSNFTTGGYGRNTELNLLIAGTAAESCIKDLVDFVDVQFARPDAFVPDDAWLDQYQQAWETRPRITIVSSPSGGAPTIDDLDVAWSDYFKLIKAQHLRPLLSSPLLVFGATGSYMSEVSGARRAFRKAQGFASMSLDDRNFALGLGTSSGFFGRMKGAGLAVSTVQNHPDVVARFLDPIPLEGPVGIEAAMRAFGGIFGLERFSVGVASRLLAAKRPDLFLPINEGNRLAVRRLVGSAPTTVRGYQRLTEAVWALPWFRAARPTDPVEQSVWDARVALLDAVLYDGRGS